MAALLYRLGQFSARRAWAVIVGWLVILGLAVGAFLTFGGALSTNFNIPGTATDQVTKQLAEDLPDYAGAAATVVFRADDGTFDDTQRTAIAGVLDEIDGVDGVATVINPFDSEQSVADQTQQLVDTKDQLATASEQLDAGQQQLDAAVEQAKAAGMYDAAQSQFEAEQAKIDSGRADLAEGLVQADAGQRLLSASADLRSVSEDGSTALGAVLFDDDFFTLSADVKTEVAGILDDAGIAGVTIDYSSELTASIDGILGVGELIGVALALIVLIIMLRAFLPAIVPMISSIIGVGVGIAGAMALSQVVDMSSVTPALGVMLGLAVGIDYALFIINRHRRQLAHGMELHESIGLATGTAGSAVVFAGATVIVALLALTVTGIPFLGTMGVVAAFCVLIAVLVAVTLVPAFLRLIGMRTLSRRARAAVVADTAKPPTAPKPLRTRGAIAAVVIGVIGLLAIASPVLSMRLGILNSSSEPIESTQYQTYSTVADEFGPGRNAALLVVAEPTDPVASDDLLTTQADFVDFLMAQDDVVAAVPVGASDAGDVLAFQVIPSDGPMSESTEALVHSLRDATPPDGISTIGVAGSASAAIDISEKLAGALPLYLIIIAGIAIILLIAVFRSILVPITAALGFILSLFAALGAVTAVYQWGWLGSIFGVHDPGPVLSFAPILIIGMLFGLAMDYQIFLVAGMREAYVHGASPKMAVVTGLRNGRAVVTAAAIIMASVFGGFIFSEISTVRPLGFGLAIGVLFDAFVVRMLIIPAVIHLLGRSAWWIPKWLDRILPNVDVEGAALERPRNDGGTASAQHMPPGPRRGPSSMLAPPSRTSGVGASQRPPG